MAIVEPSLSGLDRANRFPNDEITTVELLAEHLPDSCTIFHSVDWVNLNKEGQATFGEVDLCIVGPSGITVTIEQKNGALYTNSKGIVKKRYGSGDAKSPAKQLTRSRNKLVELWKKTDNPYELKLAPLIYLPDHVIDQANIAIDNGLIIDESKKEQLADTVSRLLKLNSEKPNDQHKADVLQFFRRHLNIMPSVKALFSRQRQFFAKKQNELTGFIQTLSFSPKHLVIEGGAGSGKTQIAVELFQQALNEGKRPLMLCYNRPLAQDLEQIAKGTKAVIANVDKFANDYMKTRAIYDPAEKSDSDIFSQLKLLALEEPADIDWQFDVLIIDEAQDFTEENFQFACHFLMHDSDIIVLKDNKQNLYSKGFNFKPVVSLTLDKNFRNSLDVISFTDALLNNRYKKQAEGLHVDLAPSIETYQGEQGFMAGLIKRINHYLNLKFSLEDMVIIVGCGQDKSWLMKQHQLGPWKIKRYTGEYSESGEQLYTEGELLVDTVYRFKGRQKPIVLFTEIDFETWSEKVERLLYVGCTRAEITCSLFISTQAEQAMLARYLHNTEICHEADL